MWQQEGGQGGAGVTVEEELPDERVARGDAKDLDHHKEDVNAELLAAASAAPRTAATEPGHLGNGPACAGASWKGRRERGGGGGEGAGDPHLQEQLGVAPSITFCFLSHPSSRITKDVGPDLCSKKSRVPLTRWISSTTSCRAPWVQGQQRPGVRT